jgi:hypothetical protein
VNPKVALLAMLAAGCTGNAAGVGTAAPPGSPSAAAEATAFWLPINSERFGVSGRAKQGVCVGLVWDFSNRDTARMPHCDDFGDEFPYAVVKAASGGCGQVWDYQRNAVVLEASGCIEPAFDGKDAHAADVTAKISSALFAGDIHFVVE